MILTITKAATIWNMEEDGLEHSIFVDAEWESQRIQDNVLISEEGDRVIAVTYTAMLAVYGEPLSQSERAELRFKALEERLERLESIVVPIKRETKRRRR